MCVATATKERISAAVCWFCGARVFVCSTCSALTLLESILRFAHNVLACNVVLGCIVCVPSLGASTTYDSKSLTCIRKRSFHAPVSANVTRLAARDSVSCVGLVGDQQRLRARYLRTCGRRVLGLTTPITTYVLCLMGVWVATLDPLCAAVGVVLQEFTENR